MLTISIRNRPVGSASAYVRASSTSASALRCASESHACPLRAHALGDVLEHLVDEHAIDVGQPPPPAGHAVLEVAPGAHRARPTACCGIGGADPLDLMRQALEIGRSEPSGAGAPTRDRSRASRAAPRVAAGPTTRRRPRPPRRAPAAPRARGPGVSGPSRADLPSSFGRRPVTCVNSCSRCDVRDSRSAEAGGEELPRPAHRRCVGEREVEDRVVDAGVDGLGDLVDHLVVGADRAAGRRTRRPPCP